MVSSKKVIDIGVDNPEINFSNLKEESEWTDEYETEENLVDRINKMNNFIKLL